MNTLKLWFPRWISGLELRAITRLATVDVLRWMPPEAIFDYPQLANQRYERRDVELYLDLTGNRDAPL